MKQFFFLIILALVPMLPGLVVAEKQSSPQPGTGLEGVISISPIRGGPIRADVPDSAPLAKITFVVKQGDRMVATFQTDDQGRFRISLAPGHYTVVRNDWTSAIGKYGPFEVDVTDGQFTKVQWQCDTGLR